LFPDMSGWMYEQLMFAWFVCAQSSYREYRVCGQRREGEGDWLPRGVVVSIEEAVLSFRVLIEQWLRWNLAGAWELAGQWGGGFPRAHSVTHLAACFR